MARRPQHGLALIEQIAAILTIGTASAIALPQLAALQTEAAGATLQHLTGAANTAMLLNQGGCLVTGHQPEPGRCRPVHDCADLGKLLHGGLPDGYAAQSQPLSRGTERSCQLMHTASGRAADFTGLGAGH